MIKIEEFDCDADWPYGDQDMPMDARELYHFAKGLMVIAKTHPREAFRIVHKDGERHVVLEENIASRQTARLLDGHWSVSREAAYVFGVSNDPDVFVRETFEQ
jgi:hypothetical protein